MARDKQMANSPAQQGEEVKTYIVLTDRHPFWGGAPCPQNKIITSSPDHPAIVAMLGRGWIREA